MKKRPILVASLVIGATFAFFALMVLVVAGLIQRPGSLAIGEKVGVIEVAGIIKSSKLINEQLKDFRDDRSIKAIVLRVDSPGGGVGPSQEIHAEVKKTVGEKPVVVSMASVAASGGYYVAAPASRIVANPGTITGSIGVIMEFTNVEELFDKIGLGSQVVKSGPYKDIGSPVRPMVDEDRRILQQLIDDVHLQFVDAVAAGRKLEREIVLKLADGRIYTGRMALEMGLVDDLGNLEYAVALAAELGGIDGEPKVVYPEEEKPDLIKYLIQESATQVREVMSSEISGGLQFRWSGIQ